LFTKTKEIHPAAPFHLHRPCCKLRTRKILQQHGLAFKLLLKISGSRQKLILAVNAITNRQRKMKKTTKTVTPPAPATKASAKKTAAPAVKKTVARKPPTVITINANIGFGNTLYLRGDGPGLNWDKGVPLDCLSDDKWSLTIEHGKPFIFKVLLNDLVWCAGDDYIAAPGASIDITPDF
jgi:hypothetical protein